MATTRVIDPQDVLKKLNIGQKIALLTGDGWWHTVAVPELGVPAVRMSDGPNGVRGIQFFNGTPSSCFPSSTGLGSSFDIELAEEVGKALGEECRVKGCHVLLGPTVNTQRSPLGGRGFESFSEDPELNGSIAAAYINGVQSTKVVATIKHFVANDQEFQRFSISSDVSDRALREIYMKPFQIALKKSNPWAVMTSYNRVNGVHASECNWLLRDVLRGEWGYKGLVMSDWTGVYSTAAAVKAGLDIEMPGPTGVRGPAIARALLGETLFMEDIDACLLKILELVAHAQKSGIPFDAQEKSRDTPELRALLRKAAADAVVLLKNEKQLLPLQTGKIKTLAVIGPNAKQAFTSGGGSAALRSTYTVSPLQGIAAAAKEAGVQDVQYALGAMTMKFLPLVDPYIKQKSGDRGGLFEYWNELPTKGFMQTDADLGEKLPDHVWSTATQSSLALMADGVDASKVNPICWIKFTTTFTPDEDGDWKFDLSVSGRGNLFFDGRLVIDLSTNPVPGDAFFGMGTETKHAVIKDLKAGKPYSVEVRISNKEFVLSGPPFTAWGGMRLGGYKFVTDEQALIDANELARKADVVILVAGLNGDWESEGFDRPHMKLPGLSDSLISDILKANPNTIVVNQSGTPVEMPWISEAHTLLQAFYGGNELGNGLADVIFGKVNPSAKLALTFPKRLEDNPSYPSYGDKGQEYGKILYNEGIFVGYRGYDIQNIEPLFPFGFGLSYTTFAYSNVQAKLTVSKSQDSTTALATVTFTLTNTGSLPGKEVVQVYVTDTQASAPRPLKELKGFTKVSLAAGESKIVSLELDENAFMFWSERKDVWVAEKGTFEILVGASSRDIKLTAKVGLEESFSKIGL